jgi:hypothetical protein
MEVIVALGRKSPASGISAIREATAPIAPGLRRFARLPQPKPRGVFLRRLTLRHRPHAGLSWPVAGAAGSLPVLGVSAGPTLAGGPPRPLEVSVSAPLRL